MAKKVKKTSIRLSHLYILMTSLLVVLFFVIDLFFSAHKKIPQVYAGPDVEEHFSQQGETKVYLRIKPARKENEIAHVKINQDAHWSFIDWLKEIFNLM